MLVRFGEFRNFLELKRQSELNGIGLGRGTNYLNRNILLAGRIYD